MKSNSIISIDMGGTKVLSCIINSKEGIIARVKKSTDPSASKSRYVKSLAAVIHEVINSSEIDEENIKAVCLGVPGAVNPEKGIIVIAPNIGLEDFNIKKSLEQEIKFPVLLENDVNLGALGIKNFGVGREAKNLLAVFVGTGIGGGLIFNGELYRGSSYLAGEIGHMLVMNDGPECGCGNKGCFEAVASRTAIVGNIISDIKKGKRSSLTKMVFKGERIKSKALASAVNDNDKVVIKRIKEACEVIGGVLASLTNLLNLDMIVLGGGLIEALDSFMLPIIKDSFRLHTLKGSSKAVKIVVTELGDDAAIYGGVALAEEFLGLKV